MPTETQDYDTITKFISSLPNDLTDTTKIRKFYFGLPSIPTVCSDGVQRPNILDYIDFICQLPRTPVDTQIYNQMLKSATGYCTATLSAGTSPNQFVATVTKGTGPMIKSSRIVQIVSQPIVTLTNVTKTTDSSGTIFLNSAPSDNNRINWNSSFSTPLSVSAGYCYITATPSMVIYNNVNRTLVVGLSSTAPTLPAPVVAPANSPLVPTTNIYGFVVNRDTSAQIRIYVIKPGDTSYAGQQIISTGVTDNYTTMPVLTVAYNGTVITYSVNGGATKFKDTSATTDNPVSLSTLYASGLFSFSGFGGTAPIAGDSLINTTWGSLNLGPKGPTGPNGSQGSQGVQGIQGPGFSTIGGTTTNGCLLTANGSTNSANGQPNLTYLTDATTSISTLTAPTIASSTGAIIAPISSTINGTLRTGFSSFTAKYTTSDYNSSAAKVVLSGLQTSGLYICSIAGMNGSNYTKLSQIYITKTGTLPSTTFVATKFGTDIPATSVFTWNMPTVVAQTLTTPSSFSLSFSATAIVVVYVSITLVASTPNLY
jgi:hypothetical protein